MQLSYCDTSVITLLGSFRTCLIFPPRSWNGSAELQETQSPQVTGNKLCSVNTGCACSGSLQNPRPHPALRNLLFHLCHSPLQFIFQALGGIFWHPDPGERQCTNPSKISLKTFRWGESGWANGSFPGLRWTLEKKKLILLDSLCLGFNTSWSEAFGAKNFFLAENKFGSLNFIIN